MGISTGFGNGNGFLRDTLDVWLVISNWITFYIE